MQMVKKKNDIAMMDEFLDMLTQSAEWTRINEKDPWIQSAYAEKGVMMEKASLLMEKKDYLELESALVMYESAITNAAIMYGIHVADAIRTISASPELVSQMVVDRMNKWRETA